VPRSTALAPRPATAIVAAAAGRALPTALTREQARAIINAAETTLHRLPKPADGRRNTRRGSQAVIRTSLHTLATIPST